VPPRLRSFARVRWAQAFSWLADQHQRLYHALLRSRDGAALLQELREMLAAPLRAHLKSAVGRHRQPPTAEVKLVVTAFVSAVLGALVWWLEAELPYTPAEMDRMLERLMSLGIGGALGLHGEKVPVHRTRRHDLALAASR
jgi:hypothetical protein